MHKPKATSAGYLVEGPEGLANRSWDDFLAEVHEQRKHDEGAHFGHWPEDKRDGKLREQWDEAQEMKAKDAKQSKPAGTDGKGKEGKAEDGKGNGTA